MAVSVDVDGRFSEYEEGKKTQDLTTKSEVWATCGYV